jgi:hypothetical protein
LIQRLSCIKNFALPSYGIQSFLGQKNPIVIASNGTLNSLSYTPYSLSQLQKSSQSWTLASTLQEGDPNSLYGKEALEFTNRYNDYLKRGVKLNGKQVMKPMNVPIDWVWILAMIASETDPDTDARKYDPMQTANTGDFALESIRDGKEGTKYYVRYGLTRELQNVLTTPWSPSGWDYSGYPNRRPDQRMTGRLSVETGIGWLIRKACIFDSNGFIVGWTPNPKDGWKEAIIDYNGGGVGNYWEKVERNYKEIQGID